MGALHCTRAAFGFAQEIYLPYICHVPNCITRYVGFLYKTALRSHRLCCHRSICRARRASLFPLSLSLTHCSPIIPPYLPITFLPLSHPLRFFASLFLAPHTYIHTEILRFALSHHMVRGPAARSFIIHPVLKVRHLTQRACTRP